MTVSGSGGTLSTQYGATLNDVRMDGVSTLALGSEYNALTGDNFSHLLSISAASLVLNDTVIDSANGGLVSLTTTGTLEIGAQQHVTGYAMNISGAAIFDGGASFTDAKITSAGCNISTSGTGDVTFGAGTILDVGQGIGTSLTLSASAAFVNQGTIQVTGLMSIDGTSDASFTNQGTIIVSAQGDLLLPAFSPAQIVNSGVLDVSAAGTFQVDPEQFTNTGSLILGSTTVNLVGAFGTAALAEFTDGADTLYVAGTLDLGGGSFDLATAGGAPFALNGGTIQDGTADLAAGEVFSSVNGTNVIASGLSNDGTFLAAGFGELYLDGPVTGSSTISAAGTHGLGEEVAINGSVGAGQTIITSSRLLFGSVADVSNFAGTVSGFHLGDQILIDHVTLTSAAFSGNSITATLSTGATLSIATSTALTGSLSVHPSGALGGYEVIDYASTSPSLNDWTAMAGTGGMAGPGGAPEPVATLPLDHHGLPEFSLLTHHT